MCNMETHLANAAIAGGALVSNQNGQLDKRKEQTGPARLPEQSCGGMWMGNNVLRTAGCCCSVLNCFNWLSKHGGQPQGCCEPERGFKVGSLRLPLHCSSL